MNLAIDVISDVSCPWCYIGKRQTLIEVAAESGLDRQAAEVTLNSDERMDVIEEAKKLSKQHGVTGVAI